VFAQTYLGTQYWSSELCSQYVDGKNEGFVFANTPQGLSELAAFVKATRTPEVADENNTKTYIYFIEVRVKNGNSEITEGVLVPRRVSPTHSKIRLSSRNR
jgi:hypothetical protein